MLAGLMWQPGRVGSAYHVFQMHAGNLCGCGMNEMDETILTLNGFIAMVGSCLHYITLLGLIWQAMPCPT